MTRRIKYILSKFRYDTLPQALLDAMKLVGIRVFVFHLFREGSDAVRPDDDDAAGFCIGLADAGDLERFPDAADRNFSVDALRERFDRGDLCVAAWSGGRVVAFSWANLQAMNYGAYHFLLGNDEAYLYDAYTAPRFRGRGLADPVRRRLFGALADQGRHTFYSTSERFNPPALRFKAKMGARVVDSGISVQLFGRWRFGTRPRLEKIRAAAADRPQ